MKPSRCLKRRRTQVGRHKHKAHVIRRLSFRVFTAMFVCIAGWQLFDQCCNCFGIPANNFACNYVVWSSTDCDTTCQHCLENHAGKSKARHRHKNVMMRVPEPQRSWLYNYETEYLARHQEAKDEFKGTDMAPPTTRFADKEAYQASLTLVSSFA